jgi:hypothetical protein
MTRTPPLTDPLVLAFETQSVDPAAFRHREHVYVAWCYLRALPPEDALARYVGNLRKLTAALGVPHKFHATMTWAYVILIHEAMQGGADETFDALCARRPDLLDHAAGAIHRHYRADELASDAARARFVLPRGASPER